MMSVNNDKDDIRYEIQHYYRLSTEINFGETRYNTFENYIHELAKECNGIDVKFGSEEYSTERNRNSNESVFITFHYKSDAQDFFNKLHDKLSPRMFTTCSGGYSHLTPRI